MGLSALFILNGLRVFNLPGTVPNSGFGNFNLAHRRFNSFVRLNLSVSAIFDGGRKRAILVYVIIEHRFTPL